MVSKKIWTLVYCLSKRLAKTEDIWKTTLEYFKKSVEVNGKFHKLKLYTDEYTKKELDLDIETKILEVEDLSFLDNYKIQILPLLEKNEILIDPDVFLLKELTINEDCDIIVDREDSSNNKWYDIEFSMASDYKFSKLMKFKKNVVIPNIGVLKFFNEKLQQKYIDSYNKIKTIAKEENLPPFPRFSILLGQVNLENIISQDTYSVEYCARNKNNEYLHIAGDEKFLEDSLNKVENFLSKDKSSKSII